MALGEATKEELGVGNKLPVKLLNDNLGAKKLAENPIFHARTSSLNTSALDFRNLTSHHLEWSSINSK